MKKDDSQLLVQFAPGAPRCGARSRRNNGNPCRNPVVKNRGRCRIHGGLSTGPATPEGKIRSALAHTTHGLRTKSAVNEKRSLRRYLEWRNDVDNPSDY